MIKPCRSGYTRHGRHSPHYETYTFLEKIMTMEQKSSKVDITNAFAKEWAKCVSAKSVLHIKAATFKIFYQLGSTVTHEVSAIQSIPKDTFFDVILGDLPLGMNQTDWFDGEKTIKAQHNWIEIFRSLAYLKKDGTALFLLEPRGFSTAKGAEFERELNSKGYFLNAIFNCPDKILEPETAITPIFAAISLCPSTQLFVAELLEVEQAQQIAHNYFAFKDGGDLVSGKYIVPGSYSGFNRIKIRQQIERLETQYKSYEEYSLGDLAVEINYVKSGGQLQERDNAVYVPNVGNSDVVSRLDNAKLKHHNYFQVVFKQSVINEYVAAFFKSTLGRLVLDSLVSQSCIPHLNKQDLAQAIIALPSLDEQKSIVQTQNKLHKLREAIRDFNSELALNPASSTSILNQLDTMLDAIGSLTDADRVRGIVREGETKRIEFKESLSLDIRTQTKEKYIELEALKTVVAFLNTEGGTLLIGVSDDGRIPGIGPEIEKFHKNLDKFLLHWKNILKRSIGEQFYPFIDPQVVEVDGKNVLLVECKPSKSPCYLDGNDFYVRTNPATDKLEGPKLVEYVKNHFA